MPKKIGSFDVLALSIPETSFGAGAVNAFHIPTLRREIEPVIKREPDEGSIGNRTSRFGSEIVSQMAKIPFEGRAREITLGAMLRAFLGNVSTTPDSPETGVHTHVFSPILDSNTGKTYQIEMGDVGNLQQYVGSSVGALMDEFSLKIVSEDYVNMEGSFMAQFPAAVTEEAIAFETEKPFVAKHVNVDFAADLGSLSATPSTKVASVEVNMKNNAEEIYLSGDVELYNLCLGVLEVEIVLELIFEDAVHYDNFRLDALQALRIEAENTGKTIGLATNPRFRIDLAQLPTEDWKVVGTNKDILRQTFKMTAEYSQAEARMIEAELINTHVDYDIA